MFLIDLDLRGCLALLVGAGRVGRRKLGKLLQAGARVRLVEPDPTEEISALAGRGLIELRPSFSPELLAGVSLVLVASTDRETNKAVARTARERGLWVNVADEPDLGNFIMPAVVEQGDFRLAVSTGGGSPALAAQTAARLRAMFGPEYGLLTRLLAAVRPLVLAAGLEPAAREAIFRDLAESEALRSHLARRETEAVREVAERILAPVRLPENFYTGLF